MSDKWETSVSLDALLNENKDWGNTYGTSIYSSGPLMNDKLGLTLRFREFTDSNPMLNLHMEVDKEFQEIKLKVLQRQIILT